MSDDFPAAPKQLMRFQADTDSHPAKIADVHV